MDDCILVSIKRLLGIQVDDTSFDSDIILHINSVLMVLTQLGIQNGSFMLLDGTEKWSDYLGERIDVEAVKTYIFLKVKLIFDPPINSSLIESVNRTIGELEWRLNVSADTGVSDA